MNCRISNHASGEIQKRNISIDLVEEVLQSPPPNHPQNTPRSQKATKTPPSSCQPIGHSIPPEPVQ
jgi:hypothetical protein